MPALTFFKCSPGGNPTLLLLDTGLQAAQQAHVAGLLLSPQHLYAEQVGFINLDAASLHMAGGEFCVNATRSLGAVLALQQRLHTKPDGTLTAAVQVSGMDRPVQLEVQAPTDPQQRTLEVAALVPLPAPPLCEPLAEGIVLVRLPGIVHVLVDATLHPLSEHWQTEAASIRQRFDLEQHEAVGCIWWQGSANSVSMKPIVWVRELASACFESSCGSGAMACALYLHQQKTQGHKPSQRDAGHYSLLQPSGSALHISCLHGQHGVTVRISGPVTVLAEGTVYLDNLPPLA